MKKPRNTLTKEKIVETAIEWVDQNGIEALSMRRLADRLGVKAMSLYNHVKNKQQLIDEMAETIIGKFAAPDKTAYWKTAMEARAISMYKTLMQHRWAASILLSNLNTGSNSLTFFDGTLDCLQTAGMPLPLADKAINLMDSFIYGFTIQELSFPVDSSEYHETAAEYQPQVSKETHASLFALTNLVVNGEYDGKSDFEFGLGIILDGLEKIIIHQQE